jgi:hypothetical protein
LLFQVYGKADGQMLTLVVLVEAAFCANIKVAMESHPTAFTKITVYVPAVAYELLFQLYGKADGQMLILVVLVDAAFCANIKVAMESHPTALVNVTE